MKPKLAKTQTALLLVAGSVLILVGGFILGSPADFYASNGIDLGSNISLLNELKAPAGFLLASGVFIIAATFIHRQADIALSLATLLYLSYAISRFISMIFDGVPAESILQAAILEVLIGMACLALLMIKRLPAFRV